MEGKGREYTGKNNKIQSQFSALRDPSQTPIKNQNHQVEIKFPAWWFFVSKSPFSDLGHFSNQGYLVSDLDYFSFLL